MKNNQFLKFGIAIMLIIGFQKLIAQPQFIIEDKVVFVTEAMVKDKIVLANPPKSSQSPNQSNAAQKKVANAHVTQNKQSESGIIEDTIVFVQSEGNGGGGRTLRLDSIHKRLVDLKKGTYEKANAFSWYNAHPTTSARIEGYNVNIVVPTTKKVLAEFRFARQKANVWVDEKFKNSTNLADIKSVVYSEQNRKATVETFGGYKYSVSINAQTGKIDIAHVKSAPTDLRVLPATEIRIYKTAKLF